MAKFVSMIFIFMTLMSLTWSKPVSEDNSDHGKSDRDHSVSSDSVPEKSSSKSDAQKSTSNSDPEKSLDMTKKNTQKIIKILHNFVGDFQTTEWEATSNSFLQDMFKVITKELLSSNDLTEEQIAMLICMLLCGLGTCPPSCPGYYEPPWGPLDPMLSSAYDLPQL